MYDIVPSSGSLGVEITSDFYTFFDENDTF